MDDMDDMIEDLFLSELPRDEAEAIVYATLLKEKVASLPSISRETVISLRRDLAFTLARIGEV